MYIRYKHNTNVEIYKTRTTEEGVVISDQSMMARLKILADSIDPNLKATTDVGSNHDHRRMPILDLNVWIEETGTFVIMHTHYIKEVSSRLVMLESSAHSERMKVNVMVNECDRIMPNCSHHLEWNSEILPHLTYFMPRMKYFGYSIDFRQVL